MAEIRTGDHFVDGDGHLWRVLRVGPDTVVLRGRGATIEFPLEPERNPIENPHVHGGKTSHPASRSYVNRSRRRPGMARALVRAFDAIGWSWGGRWTSVKDYQHVSASGR